MNRNTFYIIFGIVALIELVVFWISIDQDNPLFIQIGIILGAAVLYYVRRLVKDPREDERAVLINQKSALRTLEVFWVIFFAVSLGSIVIGFNRPFHFRHPLPPSDEFRFLGNLGFIQLLLLSLMVFLYVGFRLYYARQYGEWDSDEE
jgi:uncharacterized membrane protein